MTPDEAIEAVSSHIGSRRSHQFRTSALFMREVLHYLKTPRPYQEVESLEGSLLSLWLDALHPEGTSEPKNALDCSRFFTQLGFLFKYKTYGPKIALPFGYSLFDLKPSQGFSFQVHTEPKLEGYHVLHAKDGAFVYVSSIDEWNREGERWAKGFSRTGRVDLSAPSLPLGVLSPRSGDTTAVTETNMVHAVVGCVLEEFATCSVDAVVRLVDQNVERAFVTLPESHPDVAALLNEHNAVTPTRRLERCERGWRVCDGFAAGDVVITEQMKGRRRIIVADAPLIIPRSSKVVTSIVPVSGGIRVDLGGESWALGPGQPAILAPNQGASISSASASTVVAQHELASDTLGIEWSK